MPDPQFLGPSAVRRYAEHPDDVSPDERDRRPEIIAGYARFCGRTPDAMIAEIVDAVSARYTRRGFHTDKAYELAAEGDVNG
jgi:hypothetical protein